MTRGARGKRYNLTTVLMIVLLAKLSGANSPTEIAEWGVYHQPEGEALLRIKPKRLPERSTYRRILAYKIYETEVEGLVGEYNQAGERGEICALDGKALLGKSKREDGTPEYALSVYDVTVGKSGHRRRFTHAKTSSANDPGRTRRLSFSCKRKPATIV